MKRYISDVHIVMEFGRDDGKYYKSRCRIPFAICVYIRYLIAKQKYFFYNRSKDKMKIVHNDNNNNDVMILAK